MRIVGKPYITHEEHVRRVHAVHGNRLRVVDKYIGVTTKIRYECFKHGIFWNTPQNVVNGKAGCRRCYEETISGRCRKKHSVYILEATRVGVRVLDKYVTSHTPIRHRCAAGHTWITSPNQILSGYGCPLCDRSQYRRRPIRVGRRLVMVQGSEGTAVNILLGEGVDAKDLAFTSKEGRPTFRYWFGRRDRVYVPDLFRRSTHEVIEVKSPVTLGLYDKDLFRKVQAKAVAVVTSGYGYRLMVVHRGRNVDLGPDWYSTPLRDVVQTFKRKCHAQDLRRRRSSDSKPGRRGHASSFVLA
jgi:hypothetical protein